jgi:hypothetical protein
VYGGDHGGGEEEAWFQMEVKEYRERKLSNGEVFS